MGVLYVANDPTSLQPENKEPYQTDRVPTEIQKHNSMIFHDQQCNFHDYLMHSFQPPLLAVSSPHLAKIGNAATVMYSNKHACRP